MRGLENRIPPPVLALAISLAMGAAGFAAPPSALPPTIRWGLAAAFFAAAGLFGFPAFLAFGKAQTTVNPVLIDTASTLVVTGIYRVTRNPMYVALTLLLCAWAAWLGRPLEALGPLAFIVFITRFQIIPEERVLSTKFGSAYADYRRCVRRWL